jgi:peptidoglycan hydrolase-like protein with peptidoglycan-binding domain
MTTPTPTPQPASPTASPLTTMPDEAGMSRADRVRVQETLLRLGYYKGNADGIFGPLTREAIRRFQSAIGAETTGHLNAEEASRLVNTH